MSWNIMTSSQKASCFSAIVDWESLDLRTRARALLTDVTPLERRARFWREPYCRSQKSGERIQNFSYVIFHFSFFIGLNTPCLRVSASPHLRIPRVFASPAPRVPASPRLPVSVSPCLPSPCPRVSASQLPFPVGVRAALNGQCFTCKLRLTALNPL
jgi:hypothetical protein